MLHEGVLVGALQTGEGEDLLIVLLLAEYRNYQYYQPATFKIVEFNDRILRNIFVLDAAI